MENADNLTGKKRKERTSPDQSDGTDSTNAKKVKARTFHFSTSDSESDTERNRTPSGTVFPKVNTIRDYFSPKRNKSCEDTVFNEASNEVKLSQERQCPKALNKNTGACNTKVSTPKSDKPLKQKITHKATKPNKKEQRQLPHQNNSKADVSISSHFEQESLSSPDCETLHYIASIMQTETYENFKSRIEEQNKASEKDLNTTMNSDSPTFTPQTGPNTDTDEKMDYQASEKNEEHDNVTLTLIYKMFKDLKQDFAQLRSESKNSNESLQKQWTEETSKMAADAAATVVSEVIDKELGERYDQVTAELKHSQLKNEILTEVCQKMGTEINDLSQKVENMELNMAKRMITLTGWRLKADPKNKDEGISELENFFNQKLQIGVIIDDYFYLGKMIVIEFQCTADKRQVMASKNYLKNVNGCANVYINDYIPIQTLEKRKRERHIIKELEDISRAEKVDIKVEYTKAGLTVQGVPYKKKVAPPTAKEMMQLSLDELEGILHLKMKKGKTYCGEQSRFQAYTAEVTTHSEIRKYYTKLKLTKSTARHVVCAYIIPGQAHTSKDFHDDGEPGSGRVILQMMEEMGLTNRVVFVIRKYGGTKMGAVRFAYYKAAAKAVLEDPMNLSTTSVEEQLPVPTQQTRAPKPNPQLGDRRSNQPRQRQHERGVYDRQRNVYRPQFQMQGRGGGRSNYKRTYSDPIRGGKRSTQSAPVPSRYDELMPNTQEQLRQSDYRFAPPVNRLENMTVMPRFDWNDDPPNGAYSNTYS